MNSLLLSFKNLTSRQYATLYCHKKYLFALRSEISNSDNSVINLPIQSINQSINFCSG